MCTFLAPYDLNFAKNWQNIPVKNRRKIPKSKRQKTSKFQGKTLEKNSPQGRRGAVAYSIKNAKRGCNLIQNLLRLPGFAVQIFQCLLEFIWDLEFVFRDF